MDPNHEISSRWASVIGAVGFWSLAGAVVIAHFDPATEYELSIYAATPAGFWVGVGVAFLCGAILAFNASNSEIRLLGVLLGGLASTAVVSLPIVRGYFFHGIHDSVTHVGIARELSAGTMLPHESFYPGIHTLAAFIRGFTDFSLWRSLMFVSVVMVVISFVFTTLLTGALVDGDDGTVVGAFSAFLLIPLHQLAATLHPHPSSQATLFAPLVLYLLVRYLRRSDDSSSLIGPMGVALFVALVAVILYHPQQALNLLILISVISLIQSVFRPKIDLFHWPTHRRIHTVTVPAILVYISWVASSSGFAATVAGALMSLEDYFTGTREVAGSAVQSQTSSLTEIGANLPVMYLKLFLVSTIFLLLAGITLAGTIIGVRQWRRLKPDTATLVWYFSFGLAGMFCVFLVYFFGNVGQYYFRQASFMMLVAVVIGSISIAYGINELQTGIAVRQVAVVGFTILFVLSTLVLFNSPYIHRANQQVTEAKVSSYETTFRMTNETSYLAGIRQEPQRYYEALVGLQNNGRRDGTVNSTSIHQLQDRRAGSWYLIISQNTYEREIQAYEGLRYTEDDLTAVQRQSGVHRVHTSGDTTLYFVD